MQKMRSIAGIFISCLFSVSLGVSDVYWEPYSGIIPENAIKVDETASEDGVVVPVYVGQVFSPPCAPGALLPARIFNNSKYINPSYGGQACRTDKRVQILCSRSSDIFKWVPMSETGALKVEEDCVDVGAEQSKTFYNLYLGRTKFQNKQVYGKAVVSEKCMYFSNMHKEEKTIDNVDVLCYKDAVQKSKESYVQDRASLWEDTYWKLYSGIVPEDAVIIDETIGENRAVVSVYIGQVYSPPCADGGLLPVSIYNGSRYASPTYENTVCKTDESIKILCSRRKDIFTWVPMYKTVTLNAEEDCVVVGAERGETFTDLHFGRGEFHNNRVYGKAFLKDRFLYFPSKDREGKLTGTFDVLCYKEAVKRRKRRPYVVQTVDKLSLWSNQLSEEELNASPATDAYWARYPGFAVPSTAIIIDENTSGTPVYAGKVYAPDCGKGSVQPFTFTGEPREIRTSYEDRTCTYKKDMRLLSSPNGDTVMWIHTSDLEILNVEEDCVDGGGEMGRIYYSLYFGRGEVDNEKVYGKAVISDDVQANLVVRERYMYYFSKWSNPTKIENNFHILCYKYAVQKRILKAYVPWYAGLPVSSTL